MNVLEEIIKWCSTRPDWQQEALQRLVLKEELDDNDIQELANICKSRHGLGEKLDHTPLSVDQATKAALSSSERITLKKVTHIKGVNALQENQVITFGEQLTVVYGENATGKSGYTRILKNACRARGNEKILGDVLKDLPPETARAEIEFSDGRKTYSCDFNDDKTSDMLQNVSVFDTHCASVYISDRTDVPFRPYGLDLFDKLSNTAQEVGKVLEREKGHILAMGELPSLKPGTQAHKFVEDLSLLTSEEDLQKVATLEQNEKDELDDLSRKIKDLKQDNPQDLINKLDQSVKSLEKIRANVIEIDRYISDEKVDDIIAHRATVVATKELLDGLRKKTFSDLPLTDTGADNWVAMWRAAEKYSREGVYCDHDYPNISKGAVCVLCQQALDNGAVDRFERFSKYFESEHANNLEIQKRDLKAKFDSIEKLSIHESFIENIDVDDRDALKIIIEKLRKGKNRKEHILQEEFDKDGVPTIDTDITLIDKLIQSTNDRIESLKKSNEGNQLKVLQIKFDELSQRSELGEKKHLVINELGRLRKVAVYEKSIKDTNTAPITKKSSEITKSAVTQKLKDAFHEEMKKLNFKQIEVHLEEDGGSRGAFYHKLKFTRAPDTKLEGVVSEGEARCLSIAAFFAELATESGTSAILFDDPVSSLDHRWREKISNRLVDESHIRQVIVFTHDIVFLQKLQDKAKAKSVDIHVHSLQRGRKPGVVTHDLPWLTLGTKQRIGVLKDRLQTAKSKYEKGNVSTYEEQATKIYDLLRKTWEGAIGPILLNDVVGRHRESIETTRLKHIPGISQEDCDAVKDGMTKCSKYLHDHSVAANDPIPDPDEVAEDIKKIEDWMKSINKRR